MISVLIPSRGRSAMLRECITRLAPMEQVEVLVRVDDDDYDSIDVAYETAGVKGVIVGAPLGYDGLAIYCDEMANVARGDWLFPIGDDCTVTPLWHELVEGQDPGKLQLLLCGDPCWPIISRHTYNHIERTFHSRAYDTYLHRLAKSMGWPIITLPATVANSVVTGPSLNADEEKDIEARISELHAS